MTKLASITPANPARLAAAAARQPVDARTLFHPVEHALLRQFFKLRPLRGAPVDVDQPASRWGAFAAPTSARVPSGRGLEIRSR